jgi:farnesyl-diphosphate farnesyltransferase
MNALGSYGPDLIFELETLKKVSRSFALTIPELPQGLGRAVTNAYLICRIIDTIEDDEELPLDKKAYFFEEFVKVINAEAPAGPFAEDLYALLSDSITDPEKNLIKNTPVVIGGTFSLNPRQQKAIRECGVVMARGMLEFQRIKEPGGLKDLADFDRYCYFVAGVVGEMLTELFCDHSPAIAKRREELLALAASFGQGLQMTNIIKDLWEDRNRGACWLPRAVFAEAGYDLGDLSKGCYTESFGRGIAEMIGIARHHLKNALTYTTLIPPEESGIRKFCLWAIGMAIFTLRNINKKPDYSSGRDVKISRRTLKTIILVCNITRRSNFLLERIFDMTTRNLPCVEKKHFGVPAIFAGMALHAKILNP